MTNIAGALYIVTKIADEMKCSRRMKYSDRMQTAEPTNSRIYAISNALNAAICIKATFLQQLQ